MTLTYEFLMTRAAESAAEAEGAMLDNVKQRALRSEAAWRGMADRALKIARGRDKVRSVSDGVENREGQNRA